MTDGMRPINLRTDLAPLADLIELAFANTIDNGGRAALREMRTLSRFGPGLSLMTRLNDIAAGVHQGFVWIQQGRLVGNVSIYPARWPGELGEGWIIANVCVHPDYRREGIARQLMIASMELIAMRSGTVAILQVDHNNTSALQLYHSLGFVSERTWTTWRRSGFMRVPQAMIPGDVVIRRRRKREWQEEFELAQRVRSPEQGGLGWLRPLHEKYFHRSGWGILQDWLNLRHCERMVACSPEIVSVLWLETGFADTYRMTLFSDPIAQGIHDTVLIMMAVERARHTPLVIEHPTDETGTIDALRRYAFFPQRTTTHMRWDVPR